MALDNGYFGVFGRNILLDAKGLFGGNVSKIGLDIKRGEQSILRRKTTYKQKYIFLKNKRSFNEMKYPRRDAHR